MSEKRDKLAIIRDAIKDGIRSIEVAGIAGSSLAYLLSQILAELERPCLIVLPNSEEARGFYGDLDFFLPHHGDKRVCLFPSYDISPLMGLSPPRELISQRIEALYSLSTLTDPAVVTSLDALLMRILPKEMLLKSVDYIAINEDIDRDELIRKLLTLGYFRTSLVEETGDFSVRGGVIDLYPPLCDSPVRVELWGDTVESIRL
ncbi:MAG: transcription-repair coupling factor, partial [Desulfobacterales bacterium]|nr:transcription-repair coupling factor [Desulfobacterales bacterium]